MMEEEIVIPEVTVTVESAPIEEEELQQKSSPKPTTKKYKSEKKGNLGFKIMMKNHCDADTRKGKNNLKTSPSQ